jgi:Transposase DDE domain group 1
VASLRPRNIDASKHARGVLRLLVRRLRAAWPEVKITVRGDSGFCSWRRTGWCDSHGIGSVLGLAKNPALERAARDEIERAARQFLRMGQPHRV